VGLAAALVSEEHGNARKPLVGLGSISGHNGCSLSRQYNSLQIKALPKPQRSRKNFVLMNTIIEKGYAMICKQTSLHFKLAN